MFERVEKLRINPGKSREQIQAQLERTLARFPTELSKRRQLNVEYLSQKSTFLINLMTLCEQFDLPKALYLKAGKMGDFYAAFWDKEEKARGQALIQGYERLNKVFKRILEKQ